MGSAVLYIISAGWGWLGIPCLLNGSDVKETKD
jgi:hypothetical protein